MSEVAQTQDTTSRGTLLPCDGATLRHALRALRYAIRMETALITQFAGAGRHIRCVDTELRGFPVKTGDYLSLREGYCGEIVYGRLPNLIPNTGLLPEATAIAATHQLPIGSHIGIPIKLYNGRLFGTLCCFSPAPTASMNGDDLRVMHSFADLIVAVVAADLALEQPLACH